MFKSLLEGEEQNSLAQLIAILDPHFGVTALRRRSRLNMQMHDFFAASIRWIELKKRVFTSHGSIYGELQLEMHIRAYLCIYWPLCAYLQIFKFERDFLCPKNCFVPKKFTTAKSDQNFGKRRGRMNIDHMITFALLNLLQ